MDETRRAANAAMLSAETAKKALELCERADVQLTDIKWIQSEFFGVDYMIKNFGRTRAENVISEFFVQGTDNIHHSQLPIVVAATNTHNVRISFDSTNTPFKGGLAVRMYDGRATVAVIIHIDYKDVFGTSHRISYDAVFRRDTDRFAITRSMADRNKAEKGEIGPETHKP